MIISQFHQTIISLIRQMFVFMCERSSLFMFKCISDVVKTVTQRHKLQAYVHTMYVFDHIDTEAVSGDGCEHLPCTPPPRQVVRGAPRGDGTEQQLEVIFLGQLLGRRHECAEFHQNL